MPSRKREPAERLSHLFYTTFRLASTPAAQLVDLLHPTIGATISEWPPWIQALHEAKIPFFWATDTCPPEHQAEWATHWSTVRAAWTGHAADLEIRHNDIRLFDWGASEALLAVAAANKINRWDRLWDHLFESELETRGRTVDWDMLQPAILTSVFGAAITTSQIRFPQPTQTYWSFWISDRINVDAQRCKRSRGKLPKLRKKLDDLMGSDFMDGGDEIVAAFSISKCTGAFELLKQYHNALGWTLLLGSDIAQLIQQVEPTFEALQAQYVGLSDNAKAHEFCGRGLGWMTGMLTIKGKKAHVEVPVERGSALTDTIPQRLRQKLEDISDVDLVVYQTALAAHADLCAGRDAPLLPETILNIFDGSLGKSLDAWFADGDDIGKNAETASVFLPPALTQGWSQVPGVLLADDVGLGKTLTCLATIAEVLHLRELQQVHQQPQIEGPLPSPSVG
ncbi:hypothetical protein DFH09DRAFT_1339397 [Mycena vulgaris]|nr:hypothetical protein DFH09DRAFT_1339397 [Mycena vulgaris]